MLFAGWARRASLTDMCGRFAASAGTDSYVEIFGIEEVVDAAQPSFNLAPTDPIPAVVERPDADSGVGARKLVAPRWGLVPSWSKDASEAARLINARFETLAAKPAFRTALARRRCLIPADGYFEWSAAEPGTGLGRGASAGRVSRSGKQAFFIRPADGGLFVMAGLYEFWKRPTGEWLTTATIITTTATDALGHIHDRMPMVVAPGGWASWLDPHLTETDAAASLLSVDGSLTAYPVSPLVGNVANDGPELIEPLA